MAYHRCAQNGGTSEAALAAPRNTLLAEKSDNEFRLQRPRRESNLRKTVILFDKSDTF